MWLNVLVINHWSLQNHHIKSAIGPRAQIVNYHKQSRRYTEKKVLVISRCPKFPIFFTNFTGSTCTHVAVQYDPITTHKINEDEDISASWKHVEKILWKGCCRPSSQHNWYRPPGPLLSSKFKTQIVIHVQVYLLSSKFKNKIVKSIALGLRFCHHIKVQCLAQGSLPASLLHDAAADEMFKVFLPTSWLFSVQTYKEKLSMACWGTGSFTRILSPDVAWQSTLGLN